MSGGCLYGLPMLVPRTDESGCSSRSLLPTPRASDACGAQSPQGIVAAAGLHGPPSRLNDCAANELAGGVGEYGPSIAYWASLTRPAPGATEPNKNGRPRLTVAFDEWVMGLPMGWVGDIDIPYGAKIRLCGNGVVPQQAEAALRFLLEGVCL